MNTPIEKIMEVCLLAGKVMLQSGAETYRIEDTMTRFAYAAGVRDVHAIVTPTGIFLSLQGKSQAEQQTKISRITFRNIDLNKIMLVNDISRKMSAQALTIHQAYEQLCEVETAQSLYPIWIQLIAAATASGFFCLIFGGGPTDFLPSCLGGFIGFWICLKNNHWFNVKFFSEAVAAFVIGALGYAFFNFGISANIDKVIIGAIMPLVPGVTITNAVRDLMAGDLLSGLARGAEAFFSALAIGTGVAITLALLT